ncbi:MAG: NUDIX domain-containing protein [Acidobacteriaceae bacterium]
MTIRTLNTREIYRNKWIRLREDEIERTGGHRGIYSVIDKQDCAIVLPIEHGDIYLVEQFRYTVQQRCLELPQGGWEMDNVDPEALARGELREETGLLAERLTHLGTLYIAYGFANQKQHVFLAEGLTPGEPDFDPEEHDLTLTRMSIAHFEDLLLAGSIPDASTVAAWGLYKLWLERRTSQRPPSL